MGVGNYVLVENINGIISVISDPKTGEILVFTSKEEADIKIKVIKCNKVGEFKFKFKEDEINKS